MQEARKITSNQEDVHEDLLSYVQKHQTGKSHKPFAKHTTDAFEYVVEWLEGWHGGVIIDACCGVGESTLVLAAKYPEARVIGVDKSAARLDKHAYYKSRHADADAVNAIVIQADLHDFWRLLAAKLDTETPWAVKKQYLLYPNPYPKKSQLGKRWHASDALPSMLSVCNKIEVRSNWSIYVREFAIALAKYGLDMHVEEHKARPITPFERKYQDSGQRCWRGVSA
ncbi:tRNA (guanine(46)-N(7))-methyltransferase TrmB [Agaribacter marinus]|nr:class I SAM-dependent methyltransferase [Agaribacter marinus]